MLVSALGASGPIGATTLKERLAGFQAGAHRGGMYHFWSSGNTLRSFKTAHKAGVDIIEMDLRQSKDGVAVVFHDLSLNRQTNCRGKVESKTARAITETCRYDWTRDRIPTFREVLQWAANKRGTRGHLVLNAEFKDDDVIEEAIALLREFDAHDWVYFQTQGSRETYKRARHADPAASLLFSPKSDADVTWALRLDDPNLLIIEIHEDNGTKRSIPRIHDAGKLVSENSYYRGNEFWSAHCGEVFGDGVDIAVSNQTRSCVRQRP